MKVNRHGQLINPTIYQKLKCWFLNLHTYQYLTKNDLGSSVYTCTVCEKKHKVKADKSTRGYYRFMNERYKK